MLIVSISRKTHIDPRYAAAKPFGDIFSSRKLEPVSAPLNPRIKTGRPFAQFHRREQARAAKTHKRV